MENKLIAAVQRYIAEGGGGDPLSWAYEFQAGLDALPAAPPTDPQMQQALEDILAATKTSTIYQAVAHARRGLGLAE